MINIVLVEPEIPQNTGNVARTCACTGAKLHLVKPFGFEISDATVKRAGLDYWDKVDITYYESLDDFLRINDGKPMFFCSSKAHKSHSETVLPDECFLLFGKETKGLPESLVKNNIDRAIRIPMRVGARCLNLSNAVAIVLYEALRQNDYCDLV